MTDPDRVRTEAILGAVELLERTNSNKRLVKMLPGTAATVRGAVRSITDRSDQLPAPVRLDLLSRAVSASEVPNSELRDLAGTLVSDRVPSDDRAAIADRLIDRLGPDLHGDPFGRRSPAGPAASDDLMDQLVDDIGSNSWDIRCHADDIDVAGGSVLRISSVLHTTTPMSALRPMVDPAEWSSGGLQGAFFRRMRVLRERGPLPRPDRGWHKLMRETVDFSLGLGAEGSVFDTNLDIVHWDNSTRSTARRSMGTTYTLDPTSNGAITFDSGYVVVDEVPDGGSRSGTVRRVRALKEVRFADGRHLPFLDAACPIWSWVSCLMVENSSNGASR